MEVSSEQIARDLDRSGASALTGLLDEVELSIAHVQDARTLGDTREEIEPQVRSRNRRPCALARQLGAVDERLVSASTLERREDEADRRVKRASP